MTTVKTQPNTRFALTFGDSCENHVGMEMVGTLENLDQGFQLKSC
uniref:Uncharacterized protein n=1 Tax=viral metagenome TaxID=1070528 RepID=A0A6C0EHS9_9ZZZZ